MRFDKFETQKGVLSESVKVSGVHTLVASIDPESCVHKIIKTTN